MLTAEENKLVTETGPGTPMGELFRRFWIPVVLASDLPAADCEPYRFRILSEDLIAYKDSNGNVGIIDAYCPHRGSPLFFGRNEECGLRCSYHGWKFDTTGACVDMPNAVEGDTYKDKVRIKAYPAVERGGFIWSYMGPPEKQPPLPKFAFMDLPESHYQTWQIVSDCNWLQSLEGAYDPSHGLFLHSTLDPAANTSARIFGTSNFISQPKRPPKFVMCEETEYGVISATVRENINGDQMMSFSHMCLPGFVPVPTATQGLPLGYMRARIPVDDYTSTVFRIRWDPAKPLSAEFVNEYRNGDFLQPRMIPGTHRPIHNKENLYGLDRFMQKHFNYTGIQEFSLQDVSVIEDQRGPIMDRTHEHLNSADTMIIAVRRALINAALALQAGKEPTLPFKPELFNLSRPNQMIVPKGASAEDVLRESLAKYPLAVAAVP